jgi:hypothetical protein
MNPFHKQTPAQYFKASTAQNQTFFEFFDEFRELGMLELGRY